MINLFEYQNKVGFPADFSELELFLDEIWANREKSGYYFEKETNRIESQRFIQFLHKNKELKSNKYVGVIHFEGHRINLLPKIFYDVSIEYDDHKINGIQNHILWWLSYCQKIKFPNYQTALDSRKSDFFEVLIYLFAKYTRELLSSSIYQQYEEVNNELSFVKGRLNTNEYINQNLAKGRWHKLNCTYDAFVFDNQFNRIIKAVTKMLFDNSQQLENKKYLREILFILDEVSDVRATAEACANIKFNPMFGEFETVRDYCFLFLSNAVSFNYKNDLKLFAFLIPMESLFEDFVLGFINKEIESVTAKAQVKSTHLDEERIFALRPDLFLQTAYRNIIADTKYKIIYSDEKDPKKGISQTDLYQMLAYAVRFKIDTIILFYPNTIKAYQDKVSQVHIKDEWADGQAINIYAHQLPIINNVLLDGTVNIESELTLLFEATKLNLIKVIEGILLPLENEN